MLVQEFIKSHALEYYYDLFNFRINSQLKCLHDESQVFGEKRGSFTQFKSGDTIHVDVDMDVKQVVFSRDSERICSLSNFDLHKHVDTNMRAFVAFGNSDAIVSLA